MAYFFYLLGSEPKASILAPTVSPAIKNTGNSDQTCGDCGVVLIEGESPTNWTAPFQMLIRCPKCGTHNELPAKIPRPVAADSRHTFQVQT